MAIAVTCSGCDKTMRVKDDFAGRRALCPFCKAEIRVPSQERAVEKVEHAIADDDPPRRDDRDDEPRRRPRRNDDEEDEPRRARRSDDEYEDEPRRKRRRDEDKSRRARLRDRDEDIEVRKKGSGASSGSVLTGILMMVGSLIWFFGGLAVNVLFWYPPILFIIGLVTFIKGLAGNSE